MTILIVVCQLFLKLRALAAEAQLLGDLLGALPTAVWQARKTAADSERCRRPVNELPGLSVFASRQLDEEFAIETIGACPRSGLKIADAADRGSTAQFHPPATEARLEHEAGSRSDVPFAVGLERQIPAVRAEPEAVVTDVADLGALACVVEPHLAGSPVEPGHEPIREDPEECRPERGMTTHTSNNGPRDVSGTFAATDWCGRDLKMKAAMQASTASTMMISDIFMDVFMRTHNRHRSWKWSNDGLTRQYAVSYVWRNR
jgi:hypothetical protein